MDCSPPGSSVHGILQARILESVAIPFSRGSSQPRDVCICITDSLCYTAETINNTHCLKTISLLPTSPDVGEWPYAIPPSAKFSSCQQGRQDLSERAELQGKCATWVALNTGHRIRDLSKTRREKLPDVLSRFCPTGQSHTLIISAQSAPNHESQWKKIQHRKGQWEGGTGEREMDFYWLQLGSPCLVVNGEALTSSVACSAAPAESLWTVGDNLKRPRQTQPAGWLVLPAAQVENDSVEASAWLMCRMRRDWRPRPSFSRKTPTPPPPPTLSAWVLVDFVSFHCKVIITRVIVES